MLLKKIHSGIASEILMLTAVIVAAMSSVLFVFKLLGYTQYVFMSSDGFMSVVMFIVFLIPGIFKITVPIALLFASTITAVKMSHDRELEAWMASGVSMLRMNAMPWLIGIGLTVLALFSSLYLEPYSRNEFRQFKWMHARRSIDAFMESRLQPRTFISDLFNGPGTEVSLYFNDVSESKKEFKGVFIAFRDKNEAYSNILVGEAGSLYKQNRNGISDYVFTVYNGRFYQPKESTALTFPELEKKNARTLDLKALDANAKEKLGTAIGKLSYPLPVDMTVVEFTQMEISLLSMFQKKFSPGEFDSDDIRSLYPFEYIKALKEIRQKEGWQNDSKLVRNHTFFYEQWVVSLACLFLPVVGFCMGILDPRRKAGVAYLNMSLVIFFYYALIMSTQQLAGRALLDPELMLIIPPAGLALWTFLLLRWRNKYPPSVEIGEAIALDFKKFKKSREVRK